jgi:hypothetical protein
MLVLQQPPHQLGARVLELALRSGPPRQQHLRLDAYQRRRHLQELARPVQPQLLHVPYRAQELLSDLRDRDVENVDILLADQVQQQIERAREPVQLNDERAVREGDRSSASTTSDIQGFGGGSSRIATARMTAAGRRAGRPRRETS